jgi:diadenylate cyclase
LKGLALLFLVGFLGASFLAKHFNLDRIDFLLRTFATWSVLALIIIFQPELRRGLIRLGQASFLRPFLHSERALVDEIVEATTSLAMERIGALIAITREVGLRSYIEGGVPLDAAVNRDLLRSIFYPGNPLHDGGVIIHEGRVAAAGCLFPLSENPNAPPSFGTRHRAGIGITEESDAICVIVSEERGKISLAEGGKVREDLSPEELRQNLRRLLAQSPSPKEPLPSEETEEQAREEILPGE